MRFATLCLFSAAYAATSALANDVEPAAETAPSVSNESAPEPTGMTMEDYAVLDARQAEQNPDATQGNTQAPTITTDWRPTMLPNSQITYWEDIYTQTFAKVPDQLPSAGVGEIGLGTLKHKNGKREAEATPTGPVVTVIAQPMVMIMRTAMVVQPVQRVTQVQIIETVLQHPPPPAPPPSSLSPPALASNATTTPAPTFFPAGNGTYATPQASGTVFPGTAVFGLPSPYRNVTRIPVASGGFFSAF